MDCNNFTPKELKSEEWRDIVGYENCYQVSNLGRVKSLSRIKHNQYNSFKTKERILANRFDSKGYPIVMLYKNSKPKNFKVHRLVLTAFVSKSKERKQCNHKDGCKHNNKLSNLEWTTPSENIIHAFENGLIPPRSRGIKNPNAKLTTNDVKNIRNIYHFGIRGHGAQSIANKYNVTKATILNIVKRKTWNHID